MACSIVIVSALVLSYWIDVAHSSAKRVHRINFAVAASNRSGTDASGSEAGAPTDPQTPIDGVGAVKPESPFTVVVANVDEQDMQLLQTDTHASAPVNFLIVGTDSALGLDPDDPALHGRYVAPNGRSRADVIMLVRLDPVSGRAWVLSIPRDLRVKIPRGQENRINAALWIGGAALLVETITTNFGVKLNHYIQLDFAGFQSLVDALAGVPVWFPNPTRDPKSNLDIPTQGCYVLDGRQALQYVRGRRYSEKIGGHWRITGGSDLSRIERQQDFLVLALDRAISQGARDPRIMTKLFKSMIEMVTLDQDLTLTELIFLGEAFKDFDPDNLHRQRLDVYTVRGPNGEYNGEAAYVRKNQAILDVFLGRAETVRTSPERVRLIGADKADLSGAAKDLADQGFEVLGPEISDTSIPSTIVLYAPAHAAEAMTVARYLNPLPYLVPRDDMEGVVAVLGDDYRDVRSERIPSLMEAESQLSTRGAPTVLPDPTDLDGSDPEAMSMVAARGAAVGTVVDLAALGIGATASAPAYASGAFATDAPTAVMGRPPEGVPCG